MNSVHVETALSKQVVDTAPRPGASQSLRPEHVAYLEARAVPSPLAIRAGLRSVTAEEAEPFLGFNPSSSGLLIPYPDTSPVYARLRLDEAHGARFLAAKGQAVPVYIPTNRALDVAETLYVVEGPIKALALCNAKFPAVGLGGTSTTLEETHGARKLNDSWARIPLQRRRVVLVFDAGRRTNPNVARDEARLAVALERAGANVLVADLPPGPAGGDWGPDDFLKSRGPDELRLVLATARPADPVEVLQALKEVRSDA